MVHENILGVFLKVLNQVETIFYHPRASLQSFPFCQEFATKLFAT